MIDAEQIISGNRRALAKAITLVESNLSQHQVQAQALLQKTLPATGSSIRIGISGVPGVGKSTFIEAFGLYLLEKGKKVAVLAVDPSSPVRGGSILGDKTRMEVLNRNPNAFIRPSPTSGTLGGVAQKTRESILLCEAAGFDVVLVETVGVGQSEYEVSAMVDFFMVLMLPNAGDDLQGIKRGIMELADALIINKVDGDSVNLANRTLGHIRTALHLVADDSFWQPQVKTCSAVEKHGIEDIWSMLCDYENMARENGYFESKRSGQRLDWLQKLIHQIITQTVLGNDEVKSKLATLENDVLLNKISVYNAAQQISQLINR